MLPSGCKIYTQIHQQVPSRQVSTLFSSLHLLNTCSSFICLLTRQTPSLYHSGSKHLSSFTHQLPNILTSFISQIPLSVCMSQVLPECAIPELKEPNVSSTLSSLSIWPKLWVSSLPLSRLLGDLILFSKVYPAWVPEVSFQSLSSSLHQTYRALSGSLAEIHVLARAKACLDLSSPNSRHSVWANIELPAFPQCPSLVHSLNCVHRSILCAQA